MPRVPHTRVRIEGTLGDSSLPWEGFSTGFTIHHDGDTLTAADHTVVTTEIDAWWARAATKIGSLAIMRTIKFTEVDATGHATATPEVFGRSAAGGGGGQITNPPQIALAVTLEGPPAIKRVRGRMYLPLPLSPVATTGVIDLVPAQGVADSTRTLFENINTGLGAGAFVGIDSLQGAVAVRTVKVGRVLDTIRSRRRDLQEAYVSAAALS